MTNLKKIFPILTIILIYGLLLYPSLVSKALETETGLKLLIDKESFLDPDYLQGEIHINKTAETQVLVSQINLNYDPEFLNLTAMDLEGSWCSIVASSSIDNLEGHALLTCGNPDIATNTDLMIMGLKFKKISEGQTKIDFEGSKIMSMQNEPINILGDTETHNIIVLKSL